MAGHSKGAGEGGVVWNDHHHCRLPAGIESQRRRAGRGPRDDNRGGAFDRADHCRKSAVRDSVLLDTGGTLMRLRIAPFGTATMGGLWIGATGSGAAVCALASADSPAASVFLKSILHPHWLGRERLR